MQIYNCLICMEEPVNGRFGIGHRIFTRKNELQVQELLLHTQFDKGSFTALENTLAYGLTRTFGVEFSMAWIFQNNQKGKRTSGLGDISLEAQWHFYTQKENLGNATVGIQFPTGNTSQEPFLGLGTYGWIFELEGVHSSDYWYALSSCRIRINQRRNNKALGPRFLYELTAGPKLHLKNGAQLHLLYDLDLLYDAKTKKFGKTLFDSGGRLVLLGPLISYKKGNLIIEGSLQLPIAQQISDFDPKVEWVSIFTVEVTF